MYEMLWLKHPIPEAKQMKKSEYIALFENRDNGNMIFDNYNVPEDFKDT